MDKEALLLNKSERSTKELKGLIELFHISLPVYLFLVFFFVAVRLSGCREIKAIFLGRFHIKNGE